MGPGCFGSDLNPSENRWVGSTRIIMNDKIAEDEDDWDCNHKRPYLRDAARRDT
jgi:hypothetical protein